MKNKNLIIILLEVTISLNCITNLLDSPNTLMKVLNVIALITSLGVIVASVIDLKRDKETL